MTSVQDVITCICNTKAYHSPKVQVEGNFKYFCKVTVNFYSGGHKIVDGNLGDTETI